MKNNRLCTVLLIISLVFLIIHGVCDFVNYSNNDKKIEKQYNEIKELKKENKLLKANNQDLQQGIKILSDRLYDVED